MRTVAFYKFVSVNYLPKVNRERDIKVFISEYKQSCNRVRSCLSFLNLRGRVRGINFTNDGIRIRMVFIESVNKRNGLRTLEMRS